MTYRSVEERHRLLTILEQLWDKYPTKSLSDIIHELQELEDDKLAREISRRLQE